MLPENEPGGSAAVESAAPSSAPAEQRAYKAPREEREVDTSAPASDGKEAPKKEGETTVTKGGLKVTVAKPKSRFQERISDLVSQRNRYEQEARELRDQITRQQQDGGRVLQPDGQAAAPAYDPNDLDSPLTPDQFETYGEFVQALTRRTVQQERASQQEVHGQQAMQQYQQQKVDKFQEHAAPLMAEHGDAFMEAITDPNLPVSEAMASAVLELDDLGPYVMLHLAANPKEASEMSRLNPRAATVAIGRLAAKLHAQIESSPAEGGDAAAAPAPPPVAKPRVMPSPRGAAPSSLDSQPSDKDNLDEWVKKETQRLRGKYGPGFRAYGMR